MTPDTNEVLTVLAHKQDELWDRDARLFVKEKLPIPFAYIIWAHRKNTDVEMVELGAAPSDWPFEIVTQSTRMGGNPTAVVTVGMGTMLTLSQNEEDAQTLMSLSAGLKPTDLAGSRDHLISHLKTISSALPNRVMGAPIESDGKLGPMLDSGFDSSIVEGTQ